MQWTIIIDHIPEILAVFIAVASGVRWWLQWRARQAEAMARRRREFVENAPAYLDSSLESMQDFIDFYAAILDDCRGNLEDCLRENRELRRKIISREENKP